MTEHTSIAIPTELLEQVERGNVLLFIGERLSRDSTGEVVLDRLTTELAERAGVTDSQPLTFPQVAQAYEDARGRQALVDFVLGRIAELGDEPQPVHRLIAQLTQCSVLVTTTLSGRIERAFRDAGRKLQVVIRNEDIAFGSEQVAQLYKLRGSLDQPHSLIFTEDDNEQFFHDQASLSVVLQSYLARKTILFIGYDLDDEHFKQLYSKITAALDPYSRRSYAFGETPPPHVARWCKRKGIDVVAVNTTDFLQALTDQLAVLARPPAATTAPVMPAATPLPEQPYKLLDYFEADDAAIYFGREREIVELSAQILAHRLTLLYGASGVGKTSLLLAGIAPRLAQQDQPYETVYARALEDPAQVIRRALSRRLPDATLPPDGALVEFLAAATRALGQPLVLILDQFEEFFIRLSPQFRAAFTAELGAICDARDMPIKLVLSLREDWLASVNELERRIPEVFRNRMRVLPLTREQAQQAITAPVERLSVRYEPALVEQLLDDLAGSSSSEIMPPQLQLVCSALYRRLAAGERTITLASYTQIGGARGVLQEYLHDELALLSRDDQTLARAVLAELVTSQGTKAVRSADELALALDAAGETLAPVLERLTGARLLRAIEREDGVPSYELAHEYLIREIELDADAKIRKQAEELIRQEVDNWQRYSTLLAADKLALINDARAVLRLGPEAQELLLRSALEVGDEVEYWLGRMDDPAQRARVLADKARTRVPAVRVRTAGVLGTQDVPESVEPLLALALHAPDYGVRDAARASLAKLIIQRPAIVERLQTAAQSKQRTERTAALRALTWLPLRELPAGLRRSVLATRVRLRAARIVQASVATPSRRAALITAGLLLVGELLTALVAVNAYFIDVRPASIQDQRGNIIIRRGLPILPGLSQVEVDTGIDISQVAPDRFDTVIKRQLWGVWMLRGKRDYDKWGKDLAVTLSLENGVPMLWYLNPDEGRKWLLEAATSTQASSRAWSARALGEILLVQQHATTISAYETLVSLLKDSDDQVRFLAASALDQAAINPHAGAAVIAALLPLLNEADPDVRFLAASALGQVATNPQANVAAVVAALRPLLKEADQNVRAGAARVLGQAASNPQANGAEIVAALLPLLKDSTSNMRASAASALGQAATNPQANVTDIVAALLPLLKDTDSDVRASAASALGQAVTNPQANGAEIVAALRPLLKDTDLSMRAGAASALGQAATNPQANGAEIVAALRPLLNDANQNVRASAASALGQAATNPQANGAEIVAALLPLLNDANQNVRFLAASALDQVATNPQAGATVVAALLPLLKDSTSNVRYNAARALGQAATNPQVNGAEIVAALLPLLKDTDLSMRASAARALGQAATNPQANVAAIVAALLPLLNDANQNVRNNAVSVLGQAATNPQANGAEIVAALLPLLNGPDSSMRASAARALGQAATNPQANGAEIVAALLPLLNDSDSDVRTSAATALPPAYTTWDSTATEVRAQIFKNLIDSDNPQARLIAARALFLIALRNQEQAQHIRVELGTDTYAHSRAPIARLWSNKVLTMLQIVDLVHAAEAGTAAQKQTALRTLGLYQSTQFFGEDFTWAAKQASDRLEQQAKAQPGASP